MWPWSVLGIEPVSDERAIKKAYARKLKECRPEDDPKGFEELVKAKDAAINMAKSHMIFSDEDNSEPSDPLHSSHSDTIISASEKTKAKNDEHLHDAQTDNSSEILELQFRNIADPASDKLSDVFHSEDTMSLLEKHFEGIYNRHRLLWNYQYWLEILKLIDQLNLQERMHVQVIILKLFSELLYDKERALSRDEYYDFQKIVMSLNQEFRWTDDDRIVYNVLGFQEADHLMICLRNGLEKLPPIQNERIFSTSVRPSSPYVQGTYQEKPKFSWGALIFIFIIISVIIRVINSSTREYHRHQSYIPPSVSSEFLKQNEPRSTFSSSHDMAQEKKKTEHGKRFGDRSTLDGNIPIATEEDLITNQHMSICITSLRKYWPSAREEFLKNKCLTAKPSPSSLDGFRP